MNPIKHEWQCNQGRGMRKSALDDFTPLAWVLFVIFWTMVGVAWEVFK